MGIATTQTEGIRQPVAWTITTEAGTVTINGTTHNTNIATLSLSGDNPDLLTVKIDSFTYEFLAGTDTFTVDGTSIDPNDTAAQLKSYLEVNVFRVLPSNNGYQSYVATLSHNATDAPIEQRVYEDTIENITLSRNGIGVYYLSKTGGFPQDKTVCLPFGGASATLPLYSASIAQYWYEVQWVDENTMGIFVYDSDFNSVEWSSINAWICLEIRVYN
jgi:hypothetical protein